jgi:excisionase family DNA binding protein
MHRVSTLGTLRTRLVYRKCHDECYGAAWRRAAEGPPVRTFATVRRIMGESEPAEAERLLSVAEAAALLQLSQRHVRRLIADGELPARRYGRTVRLVRSEILDVRPQPPE